MSDVEVQQGPWPENELAHPWYWRTARGLCRICGSLLFDLKAYGLQHIPKRGGAVVVCNHQSFLDPPLMGALPYRPFGYMAKAELFQHKFFGPLVHALNAFPVRRGEGDVAAIKEAIRRAKEGKIICLFPEGTRSKHGELNPIQPGIAMLVRRAGVPVIPAVIHGSGVAWPRGKKIFKPSPVRVMYGPPLDLAGLKSDAIVELIEKRFRELLAEVKKKA